MFDVLASFYVDPLPASTLEATFCRSRAAAVVLYRSPAGGCGHEVFAMYDAIRAAGQPLDGGQGGEQPGPGVVACIITTNGAAAVVARAMVRALGAAAQPVYCPTHLVPDERYGLQDLICRLYEYLQRGALGSDLVFALPSGEVSTVGQKRRDVTQ